MTDNMHEEQCTRVCSGHVGTKYQEARVRQPELHRARKTVSPHHKTTQDSQGIICENKEGEEERAQEGWRNKRPGMGLEEVILLWALALVSPGGKGGEEGELFEICLRLPRPPQNPTQAIVLYIPQ